MQGEEVPKQEGEKVLQEKGTHSPARPQQQEAVERSPLWKILWSTSS